jgi:hypothetical protein
MLHTPKILECDWCGDTVQDGTGASQDWRTLDIGSARCGMEHYDICPACYNAIQSAKAMRQKERRELQRHSMQIRTGKNEI